MLLKAIKVLRFDFNRRNIFYLDFTFKFCWNIHGDLFFFAKDVKTFRRMFCSKVLIFKKRVSVTPDINTDIEKKYFFFQWPFTENVDFKTKPFGRNWDASSACNLMEVLLHGIAKQLVKNCYGSLKINFINVFSYARK